MTKLEKALKRTFDVELEEDDKVEFVHCYQNHMIVDVVVNNEYVFYAFDCQHGCFPY